jgi:hypothetical protein
MTPTPAPGPYPLTAILSGDKFVIITNQGNLYAMTYDPQAARMIQAAPELLEALIELCADKYLSDPINADRMQNARAAIQKAQGEA